MTLVLLLCAPLAIPTYCYLGSLDSQMPAILQWLLGLIVCGFFFTLLWCGYVQFYFSFDTSPSLRFLVELLSIGNKGLSSEELKQRFDFDDTFTRRIKRAVEGKAIIVTPLGDRLVYQNSQVAIFWATVGRALKQFFRFGKGG